jgi:hypothetical protein
MKGPIAENDPALAASTMWKRLLEYQDRDNLIGLVGSLVRVVGQAVRTAHAPGGEAVAALGDEVAPRVADRLRRSKMLAKRTWLGKAVDWFGHQDRGLNWKGIIALVQLGRQAEINTDAVRRDVDDLLVAALLADLRESLSGLANRPSNALILLDNGDMPMASAFTSALVRVRDRVSDPVFGQQTKPADPIVVVTASSGALASDLAGPGTDTIRREGSRPDGGTVVNMRRAWTWLPVRLGDFTEREVEAMAGNRMWPPELGTGTIGYLVYRLTGGHAAATSLVIRALDSDPSQIADLDKVLRNTRLTPPATLGQHLLDKIVAGLRSSGEVDRLLRDDLVTLSAARNATEAESLTGLLQAPNQELLLTSTTLWHAHRPALPPLAQSPLAPPMLPPLVRYLSLRSLAARDKATGPTWDAVFGTLRDVAVAAGDEDRAGRLHHQLALGDTASVVAELVELLPELRDHDWLALLDEITSTPDPRTVFTIGDTSPPSTKRVDVVARIVEGRRAASDPRLSDPAVLSDLYQRLGYDFGHLARSSRLFLKRAEYYHRLADRLA